MSCHIQLWLLSVFFFCVFTEALSRYPEITFPGWTSNADYITRCTFDNYLSPFCDWRAEGLIRIQVGSDKFYLSRQPGSPLGQLKSEFIYLSEDSWLEFWYFKPEKSSSDLKVLLNDDVLQTEIWSSYDTESDIWRQVFVPLSYKKQSVVQITFELIQGQGTGEQIIFGRVGVQRGKNASKCQSGTQFWTDKSTQCTCIDSQLTCAYIACTDSQLCRQSVSFNDSFAHGTCRVTSDLQYITFDGVRSRFVGHCPHVLTEVCKGEGMVPDFKVEVQNEQQGSSSVFLIQQVNVHLLGLRVTLLRRHTREIMVNGIWRPLPLRLPGLTLQVSSQGSRIVLQTHFNLYISLARSGDLQISVPNQYSSKLCGMCGNFSVLIDDDKELTTSFLAKNTLSQGQHEISANSTCEEFTLSSTCSKSEKLEYASEMYCGVLLSHHGPFSKCLSSLNALSFFKRCLFDMCTTKGDPGAFCDGLQTFAKTCKDVGVSISGWRDTTNCSLTCGPNSHFNASSCECPATCSTLDASEDCGSCEERCECDDGFLLSAGECVPARDCGCRMNEQYYERGEKFMDKDCERLCECDSQGKILCSDTSCLDRQVCKVEHGVLGCFPSSPVTCSVYGDPHYITFDGKAYSFQGTCNYTIAKTCNPCKVPFTLTARNEAKRNSTSALNSVALSVEGLDLVIKKNMLVYVNGGQIMLPYSHNTSVKVFQTGPYVQVDTNFGFRFLFNGNDRLFVQVDERYKGCMCGLCGTYSGSQFDDFLTPDGNLVPYPHDFASSWNTQDEDWICTDGSPDIPSCSPELESEGLSECSKLFGDSFKACHWFVPPQIFVDSCVQDYCTFGGDKAQLCNSLQNYVAACEVTEVFLGDWWEGTDCDIITTTAPTTNPETLPVTVPITTTPSASCSWSCNFERDECGWEQLIQDSFDWKRWSGSTPSEHTGPSSDHSTGSGFYMYIEGDGVFYGDQARMMSPVCYTMGTQCMTFWYHMYGWALSMGLNVYLLENKRTTKIWSKTNNQGNHWHPAQIEINSTGPFQIIVEGIRGSNTQSDVAWDDVTIVKGNCQSISEVPPPASQVCRLDCSFDKDLCSWTQLMTDAFDWTRHSGSTTTPMTGPSSDHTTGDGYYLYIEGDSAVHGDTAHLASRECSDLQPQCLQFWYHMYGSSWTMSLSVYLAYGSTVHEIWTRTDDQGDGWRQALVDIRPHEKFQILFKGRRGQSEMSDVALDDVSVHKGSCADLLNNLTGIPASEKRSVLSIPPAQPATEGATENGTVSTNATQEPPSVEDGTEKDQELTAQPPATEGATEGDIVLTTTAAQQPTAEEETENDTVPRTSIPPPLTQAAVPVCTMDCNFDRNLCGWSQLLTDAFDWRRNRGSTPTSMTGPSSDHTTGAGYYMYIEGDSAHHGDTARLLSTECSDPQPHCLQFWYHMYGSSWTMGLSVYLLHGNMAQEIWRRRDGQGNGWRQALVNITPRGRFKILFEGRRGANAMSDVALDDVTLHRGTCKNLLNNLTGIPASEKRSVLSIPPAQPATEGATENGTVSTNATQEPPSVEDGTEKDQELTAQPPATEGATEGDIVLTTTAAQQPTAEEETENDTVPRTSIPPPLTQAAVPVCTMDCNFDRNLCGWSQLLTDAFDWRRNRGSTPTSMTGPSSDHTTGAGYYMYIEGDSAHHGDTARLLSTECSDPQPHCLQFWYHMYGSSWTMGLSVYLLHGNMAQEIWRRRDGQGNGWRQALVNITPRGRFKILFEGRRGANAMSDVALDDITLHRGTCKSIFPVTNPNPSLLSK